MDYDSMRSELAALDSMVTYAKPQNPYSPMRGAPLWMTTPANQRAWDEEQARRRATIEARKNYLRQMLAGQSQPSSPGPQRASGPVSGQADQHGASVRNLLGMDAQRGGNTAWNSPARPPANPPGQVAVHPAPVWQSGADALATQVQAMKRKNENTNELVMNTPEAYAVNQWAKMNSGPPTSMTTTPLRMTSRGF